MRFLFSSQKICWLFLFTSHTAYSSLHQMAPIVVIGKKKNSTPFSKVTLFKHDLEDKQFHSLNDTLLNLSSTTPNNQGLFIRAGNSNHTTVMIDGIEANDPSTPNACVNFSLLGIEGIESITLDKGPHIGSHNNENLGGTLSLETERGKGPLKTELQITAGSRHTFSQNLGLLGEKGPVDYHIRLLNYITRGFVSTPLHERKVDREHGADPLNRLGGIARLGLQINENLRINLWHRLQKQEETFASRYHTNTNQFSRNTTQAHRVEIEGTNTEKNINTKFGLKFFENNRLTQAATSPFDNKETYKGQTLAFYFQNVWKVSPIYQLFLELHHQNQYAQIFTHSNSLLNVKTYYQTLTLGHTFSPHPKLTIDLFTKGHYHPTFKKAFSYYVKTQYQVIPSFTTLFLSSAYNSKAPSLLNLYDPLFGNSHLKPEKSQSFEIGIEQTLIPSVLKVGTLFFKQHYKNMIAGDLFDQLRYKNMNRANTWGFESFIKITPTQNLLIKAEHHFLHAKDKNTHAQLLRRPLHKISLLIDYELYENTKIGSRLVYYGKRADITRTTYDRIYTKGPLFLDIFAIYKLNSSLNTFLRIENALNQKAEMPSGYKISPLSIYFGVKILIK